MVAGGTRLGVAQQQGSRYMPQPGRREVLGFKMGELTLGLVGDTFATNHLHAPFPSPPPHKHSLASHLPKVWPHLRRREHGGIKVLNGGLNLGAGIRYQRIG